MKSFLDRYAANMNTATALGVLLLAAVSVVGGTLAFLIRLAVHSPH